MDVEFAKLAALDSSLCLPDRETTDHLPMDAGIHGPSEVFWAVLTWLCVTTGGNVSTENVKEEGHYRVSNLEWICKI